MPATEFALQSFEILAWREAPPGVSSAGADETPGEWLQSLREEVRTNRNRSCDRQLHQKTLDER